MNRNHSTAPRPRALVIAIAAAVASIASAPAAADPLLNVKLFRDADILFRESDMSRWTDNYVELGVGYNSRDSYRFGQFSGLTDQGGFAILGANWRWRDPAEDARYWQFHASNLGLDSRKLHLDGGVQGRWGLSFSLDQLTKSQTESTSFIHDGLGTGNLTLPAGYIATNATDPTNVIRPRLQEFGIQHGRDIYRLGANGLLGPEWDWKVNYREDQRSGSRLTGLPFSFGGGRAVLVPYPVDDRTRQIEAILSYTTKQAQFQLGYTYSAYDQHLQAFNVRNPFTNTAGNTEGRLSLNPSNDFHQLNATGAYRFTPDTRLSAKLSYGIARQNEAYLPYSANLATGAAGNVAPRSSLDGEVVKTLLDVALTSKPVDKMNLKVAYQYHDSDNRTPVANYLYLSRDGTTSSPTTSRRNAPLSTREQKILADGDYEIAPRTVLRAALERRDIRYSVHDALYVNPADRDRTHTDKLSIELRRPVSDEFLGNLGYTFSKKRGSEYDKNSYFRNTYWDPSMITGAGVRLNAHPSVRSFMYADYDEHRVRAAGNWTASETLSVQAGIDGYQQRQRGPSCNSIVDQNIIAASGIPAAIAAALPDSCLGRSVAEGTNLNVDLQWQPEENLTTFAFASVGQTGTEQRGRTWSRGAVAGTNAANEANNWTADVSNRDHALGLGLKWQPEEQWDLGGTYVVSYGQGKVNVTTGTNLNAGGAMPDNWNRLHTLQLFAKWDYSKQLTWRFNYVYENLRSYDWAVTDLTATSIDQVLLTGQQAPRYSNHVLGVSAVIKNW